MAALLARLRGCGIGSLYGGPGFRQLSTHRSNITSSSPVVCRAFALLSPKAQTSTGAQVGALGRCLQRMNVHTNSRPLHHPFVGSFCGRKVSLLNPVQPVVQQQQLRTKITFSRKRGSPKTVKPVIKRFYRLNCGLWIRRRAGYKKRLWKKSAARKYRLRQHVFCNNRQNRLLDKMVTKYWKTRKWYINDPFEKYHTRYNEFTGEPGKYYSHVYSTLNNMIRHRKYFKKGYRAKLQNGGKVTHSTYWTSPGQ
ncbi:MRPL35 [Branchiostoma lanceolatum]|uniref:Large ribosomal subunit protein bL35m n=1 Tax=Branchiostoma lanceolatum TaxID=7740 RepID=A0A8J9ZRW7_BRALA|nr:MRPL35 [Branchiostoma lanceolatum]